MINKIFLALLSLAVIATAGFAFYGYSWLSSIGNPKAAFEGFTYYQSLEWAVLWPATIVLLIVANIVFWSTRRAWALWATFAYFAVFMLIRYFWTGRAGFEFYRTIDPEAGRFDFSVLLGVIFVFLAAVIVYFDQYLMTRLAARMDGKDEVPDDVLETSEETPAS